MEQLERPVAITELLAEIESMDENCFQPNSSYNSELDEREIGEVPVYARKVYALAQMNQRERDQAKLDCKYSGSSEHEDIHIRLRKHNDRYNLLMNLFWIICKDHFSIWNKHVGVRSGWKFVLLKDSAVQAALDPRQFLGGLFNPPGEEE